MARNRTHHRQRGFTLVELMIVVAVIAVLATIAGTAYRRYMDSGRTAEAMSMLGEIRAKEEAYRAEFGSYNGWSQNNEAAGYSLPAVDTQSCAATSGKEPCAKNIAPSGWTGQWLVWQGLGINASKSQLQCGYIVNYGLATQNPSGSQPLGQLLLGTTPVGQPWWYAVAICDNDGDSTLNATFATAFNTTVVSSQYEHK